MTDKELLTYAAKAAGLDLAYLEDELKNKLFKAVQSISIQTGEPVEDITKWLTDEGGLTMLMLSHFSAKVQS